jgi:tetrahydromethanopterin S-methyltransferase subunit G
VKKVGKYAAIGAGIGAVYGLGNNLKKQRDKIEDAAGDRVAEVIRGIGKKGK